MYCWTMTATSESATSSIDLPASVAAISRGDIGSG
jgi:hypothetical protein